MANAKKTRVKILNPASGSGVTSLEHARRYVKRGQARWVDGSIEFVHQCAPRSGSRGIPALPLGKVDVIRDAFPGWPILPPSTEWLNAMGY